MKYDILMSAVHAAQMLMVIRPIESATRKSMQGLSQVRSRIDQNVAAAVITQSADSMVYLRRLHDAVMAVPLSLSEDSTTALNASRVAHASLDLPNSHSIVSLRSKGAKNLAVVRSTVDAYIDDLLSIKTPSLALKTMSPAEFNLRQGEALHQFASLIRNSDWNFVLFAMGLKGVEVDQLNRALASKHGSRQGLLELDDRIQALADPESYKKAMAPAKKTVKKASTKVVVDESMFEVSVSLKHDAILNHPEIAKLMQEAAHLPANSDVDAVSYGLLVSQACVPVVLASGVTFEAAAQRRMDVLVDGLLERNASIKKIRDKHRAEAVAEKKSKALTALRGIDSSLLKVLKENPDLLKQI